MFGSEELVRESLEAPVLLNVKFYQTLAEVSQCH